MIDAAKVVELVESELAKITDPKLSSRIRELRVSPYPVERAWDYGAPDQHYTCWTVVEHHETNTGIAYCELGFRPKCPWGLVSLSGPYMSIGMDCGRFPTLDTAFRDSMAWDESNPVGDVPP